MLMPLGFKLSATLDVELTEPTVKITERLYNQRAPESATILTLRLNASVFEDDDFRDLTEAEWSCVAFDAPELRLRGTADAVVLHRAPNGKHFTVRDLVAAVEETERQTRGSTKWFGGIDTHHRFYQGIFVEPGDVWRISWGS